MAVKKSSESAGKSGAPGKKPGKSLFDESHKKDDLTQLVEDIRERPLLYIGGVLFLIVMLVAGLAFKASRTSGRSSVMTAYAQALDKTEPSDQAAALETLSQGVGKHDPEVIYMAGETAYRAGQYDKAKAAFDRLKKDFPDSPYTPDAVEGLGNIAENAKDYDGALAQYKEVRDKWDTSFAARRQPTNIAKMEERRGNLKEAVAAYREQMQVFPGSGLAGEASAALTRLEKSNPDLFPKTDAAQMPSILPAVPSAATDTPAPAPAASDAGTASSDLKMELKTPDVTEKSPTSSLPSVGDLDMKLKTPDVGAGGTAPAAPAEQAPAPQQ